MIARPLLTVLALLLPGSTLAQDTVHVRSEDGRSSERSGGEVVDWNAQVLTLRRPGDRAETIAAERIVRVETAQTPAEESAERAFAARDYAAALTAYRQAIGDEKRRWVQQKLQAQVVRCHKNLGQWKEAFDAFELLVRSDATVLYFDAAPVTWTTEPLPPGADALAQLALSSATNPQPAAVLRLVAASWLLPTAQRGSSLQALQNLVADRDARVAFWAEAQLWRVQVVSATPDSAARWQERWQRMPAVIQPAPAFVLGQVHARLNAHEDAALWFMRSPILKPFDHHVNPAALLAAGRELETMDRAAQARTLYQEVLARYGSTTAATAAQQRLQQLAEPD